jgi:hypothetical protein
VSGTQNQRLIPANTTLFQPLSQYYRISDAVNTLYAILAQMQAQQQQQQSTLDTINARLANAGIP